MVCHNRDGWKVSHSDRSADWNVQRPVELAPDGYIRQMTTANVVAGVETKNVNIP